VHRHPSALLEGVEDGLRDEIGSRCPVSGGAEVLDVRILVIGGGQERQPLPPAVPEAMARLVNELAAIRASRVLVLDDFHLVTNLACAASVDAFTAAMPPKCGS
jgi:hypothetical protein